MDNENAWMKRNIMQENNEESVCGGGELVYFENDYSDSGNGYRACFLVGKRTKAHLASLFYFYSVENFRAAAPYQYRNVS